MNFIQLNGSQVSSIIKADQPIFLGRRKGTAGRRKGTAGRCKGTAGRRKSTAGRRKPPQGAALISMRDYDWLNRIRTHRDVHPVTYVITVP